MSDAGSARFPADAAEFMAAVGVVERCVDPSRRFPDWPFRASGFVTVYGEHDVFGGPFGRVLQALAREFGDRTVYLVGVNPDATLYGEGHGIWPAFSLEADELALGYGAGLFYEHGDDPRVALEDLLDIVAIAGSSGVWSVWAQRDWEIGLLLTPTQTGPWRSTDVPWFPADVDLDLMRSPGWTEGLSASDRAAYKRNVRERGSGPRIDPN